MKMETIFLAVLAICGSLLLVTGAAAAESASITISGSVVATIAPVAEFTANRTTGYPPLAIRFTDLSTGSPAEWQWDFENDGIIDDTVPDPLHIFVLPGIYNVSLTVRNSEGSDPEIKLHYLTVQEPDPSVRIAGLYENVQGLQSVEWVQWLMTGPLDRASGQLEKGHTLEAIHQMKTFMQVVKLIHRFDLLTDEQAESMTNETMAIIGLIQG